MTREMLDACNPDNIPTGTPIVAGYIDGLCAWPQSAWDRLGRSIQVRISSLGTNAGQVLDVEPGNPDARYAVYWARNRRAAGVIPTIYTAEWAASTKGHGPVGYAWADCIREFDAAGEPQPNYWVAPWTPGVVPPGAVAAQHTYKVTVDVNTVVDYWPGVDGVNDMTRDEMVALMNESWAKAYGISGPMAYQDGPAALLDAARNAQTIAKWADDHVQTALASLTAIQKALDAAGGHPANAPILAAVAQAQASLNAIKAKTDRDLA